MTEKEECAMIGMYEEMDGCDSQGGSVKVERESFFGFSLSRIRTRAGARRWEPEMKQLLEDMKSGRFRSVYLLYGQETYLKNQYRDKLKESLVQEGDTMNFSVYRGKDISPGEIIDLAETMPFFADRRVILIEESGWFKKGGEQMAEYLKTPSDSVCILFVETEVDKRSRLFKAVKEAGCVVEFDTQDEATLKRWILGRIRKEKKTISQAGLDFFLQRTGTDMENISREMEKLFSYTLERDVITEEDIEAICTRQISGQIFSMVEAIALRRQQEALRLYYDLLALKEPPMRILFLTGRQFNLLLQVKELKKKGYDNKKIGEKTGLHGFIVGKYAGQASRFQKEELREALEACVSTDEAIKSGRIGDVLGVELLIVKYSSPKAAGQRGKASVTGGPYGMAE